MKRSIYGFAAFLMLQCPQALADTPGDYKEVCRRDDPFLYCTQGCKETKAWKPAQPYASVTYIPQVPYCPIPATGRCPLNVEPYLIFTPWSQQDYDDYFQNRVRICPRAHQAGDWDGENGQPESTPFEH